MKPFIKDVDRVETLLEVLGTPTRLKILALIAQEPRYLSEISRLLEIGQQAIIRHMKKLERAGLVELYTKKVKRSRLPRHYYRIDPDIHFSIAVTPHGVQLLQPDWDNPPEEPLVLPSLNQLSQTLKKSLRLPPGGKRNTILAQYREKIQELLTQTITYHQELLSLLNHLQNHPP